MTALLRVEGLWVEEDGFARVVDVDLTVVEQGFELVLGAAGAGKSALIEAIATGAHVRGGRLFWRNVEITRVPATERRRLGIAAAFQNPPLFPGLTLDDHLALATADRAGILALGTLLDILPELRNLRAIRVERLDRPARRLIDLARALASRPELLLIDDLALDLGVARTGDLLAGLRRLGVTLLVADRYARPLLPLAGAASVLVRGRIATAGPASTLLNDERVMAATIGDLPPED